MDLASGPPSPPSTTTPSIFSHDAAAGFNSDLNSTANKGHSSTNSATALPPFEPSLVSPTAAADASSFSSPDRRPKKSSSTCTTCRARKVRCNGARDICSNCQRLGFPCSYDDTDSAVLSHALPRRRVKQACQSCHSRKARCSGHVPSCDRCRVQGIECVYRPAKRARVSSSDARESPISQDEEMEDAQNDSDPGLTDPGSTTTPTTHQQDVPGPHGSFDALIASTFEKFFRHVHHIPMYSFLHRASLMEQYHAGKVDKSLLLALIGITSCLTDMGPGMREYGDKCIDEAERRIFAEYTRPSTIIVQALVFMIKHRHLSHKFPSAFFLLSLASRYAASLRLNHESPNLCFLAQESRRRLMWSLFCIDVGVSGGNSDFSLWKDDAIQVTLPCNERNFEFDLPQPAEKLVPETKDQNTAQGDDIGSLALHIRIQHIRKKIAEFTKGVLRSKDIHAARMQTRVLTLHQELDDFAAQLPASFQFSDNSLHLRAYSPRLCVFVMIHLWWRQCHCDLYRIGLVGLRDALPRTVLENFPESFLEHCQRQCIDHSIAIVNIFSATQKLHAQMVADIDLAMCAYQCTRILTYAHHINAEKFDLGADVVMERANICMQAIKEYCRGKAAYNVRTDLEKLVGQSLSTRSTPSSRSGTPGAQNGKNGFHGRNVSKSLLRNVHSNGSATTSSGANDPSGSRSIPPAVAANPWSSENHLFIPDPVQDIQVHRGNGVRKDLATVANVSPQAKPSHSQNTQQQQQKPRVPQAEHSQPQPQSQAQTDGNDMSSELNNAYEGALQGMDFDNGLDYAMGVDMNLWASGNNEWMTTEFINGGVGV